MQAQAAGGGEGAQGLLQNPKVQIGVIAAGAIALIVVIYVLFFSGSGASPAPNPGVSDSAAPVGDGAMPGAPGGAAAQSPGSGLSAGAAPGGGLAPGGAPGGGLAPAAAPLGGSAAPAGAEGDPAKPVGPGVPVRKNPFRQNKELQAVLDSVPPPPEGPVAMAQMHNIYVEELYKPDPPVLVDDQDDTDGPPIPTMRVAGVVYGRQVSATLQIGQQYMQVTPGQMVPASNPIYRVDSIEQDTVHLSRRWEIGNRKGVQRIEVGLAARAASPGGGGFGGAPGGYPGAGGGYPGGAPNF